MSWRRLQKAWSFAFRASACVVGRRHRILPRTALSTRVLTNEATMSWTDEQVEQLRQAWMEGRSASQIANLLGHGLTRNAVIGKVHRLGLAGRAKSPSAAGPHARPTQPQQCARSVAPPRAATASAPRMVRGATALAIQPQVATEAQPQAIESVVVPMSVRVTIVELKEAMCRWPLGDPATAEFRYCGSSTHAGPYCAYHGGLAYQPTDARRRDRDRRLDPKRQEALRRRHVLPNVSSKA
jgi:GcrA cell cycle regulator